jgi:hypothetical protein
MKLSDLAKQVMREDTWGNNPSAAGSMSPGKTPNAVSPATQPVGGVKYYDVARDFQNFEMTIEKEEEAASKNLEATLKTNLANKKVVARASKGSVGQTEQDYTIDVLAVDVTYMSDKHYIILKGSDEKDYYINTAFKVKVLGSAEKKKTQTAPAAVAPPNKPVGAQSKGQAGGIVYPQNMGVGANNSVR